jgi:hypothetical protein
MYCKLTNQNLQTYDGFQWELGKWYRIPDENRGGELCSKSWFHCYNHPLVAILLNPAHADIKNPKLFRVRVKGAKKSDNGLKYGFTMMKLVEEIPIPDIGPTQRTAFGILCAKQVYKNKDWNRWADNWLNGKDRTADAANAADAAARAAYADAVAAAYAAYAARTAAYADAVAAAYAAYADAVAAYAATYAAYAATYAADADINLIKLAKQAMRY